MPGTFELLVILILIGIFFGLGAVPAIARRLGYNWVRLERLRKMAGKVLFWRRLKPW